MYHPRSPRACWCCSRPHHCCYWWEWPCHCACAQLRTSRHREHTHGPSALHTGFASLHSRAVNWDQPHHTLRPIRTPSQSRQCIRRASPSRHPCAPRAPPCGHGHSTFSLHHPCYCPCLSLSLCLSFSPCCRCHRPCPRCCHCSCPRCCYCCCHCHCSCRPSLLLRGYCRASPIGRSPLP